MALQLSSEAVLNVASNSVVAGTSLVTSSVVDQTGFDACCWIVKFNTIVDTSVLTLNVFENTANSTSGGTQIPGATGTFTSTGGSNSTLVVDVIKPKQRYLYATLTRATANATVDSILALQYRAKNVPVTQPATNLALVLSTPES